MRKCDGLLIAVTLITANCAWQGTPVPVGGEVAALEGNWEGTYASDQTGRSGTITFALKAGTDSAYGDVMMIPVQNQDIRASDAPRITGAPRAVPQMLRIAFLRAQAGRVAGKLDVYPDPVTGARLLTTFQGRIRGNELKGSYSTLTEGTGALAVGEWSVKRKAP